MQDLKIAKKQMGSNFNLVLIMYVNLFLLNRGHYFKYSFE